MTHFHHAFSDDEEVLDAGTVDDPYFAGRDRRDRENAFDRAVRKDGRHPLDAYKEGYRSRAWQARRIWTAYSLSRGIKSLASAAASLFSTTSASAVGYASANLVPATKLMLIATATAILVGLTAIGAFVGSNWNQIEAQIALVRQNVDCAETIALRDDSGLLIHVVPRLPDSACPQPLNQDEYELARPVLTVPFGPAAALAHAEAYRSIEGALWVDETFWGHDLRGPLRRVRGVLREVVTGQEDRSGVTGPIASVFELLAQVHDPSFGDKILSMVAASVYTARHLTSDSDRVDFVGLAPSVENAVPHRAGVLGSMSLLGTAEPTSLADQCRYARAAGLPVPMVGARGVTDHLARRWTGHVGPGAALCVLNLAESEEEAEQALAHLSSYCNDNDFCLVGEPHWHLLAEEQRDAAELEWRDARRSIAGGEAISYSPLPRAFPGTTTSLRETVVLGDKGVGATSLEPTIQSAVLEGVRDAYANWDALGLDGLEAAVAVFDIVNTAVLPLALYGERNGAIYPPINYEANAAPTAGLPPWHGASLNKIAIMMVAVREGITEVCLPNADCVALEDAFADSDNDAFLALARQLDLHLQEFRKALGYIGQTPNDPALRARDAVYGFDTRLPPYRFAVLLGALLHGEAQGVHLVGDADFGAVLDLEGLGFTSEIRSAILEVFSAPTNPGGTLFPMIETMGLPVSCTAKGGKSGTHSASGTNLQRGSVLLIRCADRDFVTFALAAHPDRLDLDHRALGPIHEAAVVAAATTD